MRNTIILCVTMAALGVFAAWLHAQPGKAFNTVQMAMDRDDAAMLAPCLDLAALRSNIKNREAAKLSGGIPKEGVPGLLGLIGQALADSVVGALAQGMATPETILAMLRGAAATAPELPGKSPRTPAERLFGQAKTELIGFDRYVVTTPMRGNSVLRLVFSRQGTKWLLSDFEVTTASPASI
ncbi:MAG: DUF2939 domain-containing protein [Desulfovibrio sp.]|nr:DUF2939 domain-containing protein [Desulfovibrio sp.]MBI4958544.1 DUF2939 domain-containing protein [Desulfovibrio sp.]